MRLSDACIIGAGPYGLTAAAHLLAAGVDTRIFGDVMSFWRSMPDGMLLRSSRQAISLSDPSRNLSLDDFEQTLPRPLSTPVARTDFVRYGDWFQRQAVPDVDPRFVETVEQSSAGFTIRLTDGETVRTRRVVVALGLAPFAQRLPVFEGLPQHLVTHSLDTRTPSDFSGRRVLVVGAGQSALEAATTLNVAGAEVELVARSSHVHWLAKTSDGMHERSILDNLLYPTGAIGPPGINWVVKLPGMFHSLPRPLRGPIFRRAVRPAGSDWIQERYRGVVETFGRSVVSATLTGERVLVRLSDGSERLVDYIVQGTGFAIDVTRFGILSDGIVRSLRTLHGQPWVGRGFESSIPGLHFVGAASDLSYGPLMRAIAGTSYAARAVTRMIVGPALAESPVPRPRRTASLEHGLGRVPAIVSSSPAAATGIALVTQTLAGDSILLSNDR